jgi:photosystem II stability/assembly factor-like uncharacterized protein
MKRLFLFVISSLIISNAEAQWKRTAGPLVSSANISMDVSKVEVSGNNLCSIIDGKIYLSNDNGHSWMYASNGATYPRSIAFSDSVIYEGTAGLGVYLSTNWGSTYTAINNGLPANAQVNDILIYGNTLLAAIYNGSTINNVYYSTDNGSSWTASTGLNTNYTIYCLATNGTYLYAGTNTFGAGIYMSADSGNTWSSIGLAGYSISSIAAYGNRLFAADNSSGGPLFFSQNNGANWSQVNSSGGPPDVHSIAINNNYIYAASYWNGVYYSSNNGASWSGLGMPCSSSLYVAAIAVDGNYLYGGTGNGFAYSLNQGSWNCGGGIKNYGLNIRAIVSQGNNLMTGTGTGTFNSTYSSLDTGQTWNTILSSTNALAVGDSGVFAGGNGFMRRSIDWGTTWSNVNITGSPTIMNLVIKGSVGFVATSADGIYYSANHGINWTQRNTGLSTLSFNTVIFTDSTLVAGSNNAGIFQSTDSGLSWNAANGLADTCIQALAGYRNVFYAGTKNHGIYKSLDNGANWVQAYFGPLDTNVASLYTCGANVFAGILGRGFLVSTDSGLTWSAYNSGLMDYNINSISANATNVFIGTGPPGQILYGGSVWKKNLSEIPLTLSVKEIDVGHKGVDDISIYPVPATNNINLNAPQKSTVEFLDIHGQLLKSFITRDANMNVNIMELTPGLYFIKIKTDTRIWIKKFAKVN